MIKIFDDLVPIDLQNILEEECKQKMDWYYLNNIGSIGVNNFQPGLTHIFENVDPDIGYATNYHQFKHLSLNILYLLSSKMKFYIDKILAGRFFMHLPGYEVNKKDLIHNDFPFPHWVCLYYVTDSEGDTILFDRDKKTEIKRVTPKKGRIVFFDGSIPHCSSRPKNTTRIILNFDFLIKENNKK